MTNQEDLTNAITDEAKKDAERRLPGISGLIDSLLGRRKTNQSNQTQDVPPTSKIEDQEQPW